MKLEHNGKTYKWIGDRYGYFQIKSVQIDETYWAFSTAKIYLVKVNSLYDGVLYTYHTPDQLVKLWYMELQPQEEKKWVYTYDEMIEYLKKHWEAKVHIDVFGIKKPVTIFLDESEKSIRDFEWFYVEWCSFELIPQEEKPEEKKEGTNCTPVLQKLRAELERRIESPDSPTSLYWNWAYKSILSLLNELEKETQPEEPEKWWTFFIKIDDTWCEWEYEMKTRKWYSIQNFVDTIEKNMLAKSVSQKLTRSSRPLAPEELKPLPDFKHCTFHEDKTWGYLQRATAEQVSYQVQLLTERVNLISKSK